MICPHTSYSRQTMSRIASAFAIALVALSFSHLVSADYCNKTTTPICGAGGSGKSLVVESIQKFCIFLPPLPTLTVLESEGCCGTCDRLKTNQCASVATDAVVHCTDPSIAPGAKQLPAGLIASAHLVKAADGSKIQITGTLNNVYIMANDDGGQYDHTNTGQYEVNSPPGGGVSGYDEYVNLVGTGVFCIQLCKGTYNCNSDNDYTGCLVTFNPAQKFCTLSYLSPLRWLFPVTTDQASPKLPSRLFRNKTPHPQATSRRSRARSLARQQTTSAPSLLCRHLRVKVRPSLPPLRLPVLRQMLLPPAVLLRPPHGQRRPLRRRLPPPAMSRPAPWLRSRSLRPFCSSAACLESWRCCRVRKQIQFAFTSLRGKALGRFRLCVILAEYAFRVRFVFPCFGLVFARCKLGFSLYRFIVALFLAFQVFSILTVTVFSASKRCQTYNQTF
ncbi:hypothetical protein BJ742DRAFT_797758 [Cladochytrium replicatum]|nr:hypothetical protein BJ742DRAFT_797758 [Cladochytrium replicatum]